MTFKANARGLGTAPGQAGSLIGGAASGLTATGSTQADALLITTSNSQYSTVASGTGAIVPAFAEPGDYLRVMNSGANALLVYPQVGGAIGNGATNAGFSVAANKSAMFHMASPTLWGVNLSA